MMTTIRKLYYALVFLFLISCANIENNNEKTFSLKNQNITSGEILYIDSVEKLNKSDNYTVSLIDNDKNVYEKYKPIVNNNSLVINRFLNKKVSSLKSYSLLIESNENKESLNINLESSLIVESLCNKDDCKTLTGNALANIPVKLIVASYKFKPVKFVYDIVTPYNSFSIENSYSLPVSSDWIENVMLDPIPNDVSFYIALFNIKAYDDESNMVQTSIPIKVVRPFEIKHFGKHELAEVYEPVPVTGCIPGSVGNNVNYSESTSETRQNSVSITVNKSWSDSFSSNQTQSSSEGINVSETQGTVNSSSLSNSETQSESYTNTASSGESNNISFNTSEGENWSWTLNNTETESEGQSSSNGTNTGVNASTTVGVSGEGSLPFLAKASGKIDVSAGVSRNWSNTDTNTSSESSSESRGYTTGGSSQNGRTYGSVQNDSRSHSLTGAYVLSSNVSSSTSESASLSSGRVWNMSESISSGKVVTESSGESIAQTIVSSNTSSTTFSYSGYIPRGRFGVFFRQTSRYVKLSEIITYDLNGFPSHAGFIMMNTWAWAPELSVGQSCQEAIVSSMPLAECLIPPCGE